MRYVEKLATNALVIEAESILDSANHYNESDRVKEIIRILYSGCCAFCGSAPEPSSYYQIEHFYPKSNSHYKKYSKSIFNLHYGCQRCNNLKGSAVHINIFSPNYFLSGDKWVHTSHSKIDSELVYIGYLAYSINNRPGSIDRAQATIDLFDLNNQNGGGRSGRRYLVEERLRTYNSVYQILETIFQLIKEKEINTNLDNVIKMLFMMIIRYLSPRSPYSNIIAHNFGDAIFKLLMVYLKNRRTLLT